MIFWSLLAVLFYQIKRNALISLIFYLYGKLMNLISRFIINICQDLACLFKQALFLTIPVFFFAALALVMLLFTFG